MSISGAMTTAVMGLTANSTAVARISENIANSGTVGYKRTFADMVTATNPGAMSVSGVKAVNGSEIGQTGLINATGNTNDLAVSGTGFFVVSKTPNDPLLSNYFLTRAGSFRPDENGYMVNSAGYYLAAYPYDTNSNSLGAIDRNGFNGLSSVQVGEYQLPAIPSTAATVKGNLPAQETAADPLGAAFLSSMEFFTQLGRSENLNLEWQPTAEMNTWHLRLTDTAGGHHGTVQVSFSNSGATPGAPSSYTLLTYAAGDTTKSTPLVDGTGAYVTANADGDTSIDPATGIVTFKVMSAGEELTLTLNLGEVGTYDGVQQFVGDFTPQRFSVDGAAQTALARSEIDEQGTLWGVFDDGRRIALYEVPLAQVVNPDGLTLIDGNAYQATRAAGAIVMAQAGTAKNGTIVSSALEASTVDIATELTDLIRVQRAYSSNAKIVTTADEMLQEVTSLKR